MRMKMVCDDRTLREVANEFLALKKALKIRERTVSDYQKYINKFLAKSQNTLDVDVLKVEILDFFSDIPTTSPARFNHPYQYLHALFAWCGKQDYLPYNPFEKLDLKKNLLICCIIRGCKIITPRGKDVILVGDTVIVVTTNQGLNDIHDIMA